MNNIEHINRRKFERHSFEHTFVVETENFSGISSTSSLNLSQKGAHLISTTPMAQGSIVSIEVPSEKIQLMGEVCWVSPQQDKKYNVGVAFHEFFPTTKAKIANLIERIQTDAESVEGNSFSFELENKVSNFLNKFVEELRPDPIVSAPVSYRRLGTPTEKTLSFYTPSKPQTLEGTTTSFRIDDGAPKVKLPFRSVALVLLAFSLLFFKNTFTANLTHWLTNRNAPTIVALSQPATPKATQVTKTSDNQATFQEGLIQKIQWDASAKDRIVVTFGFSEPVSTDQFQISKINFNDQPRQLIKILNATGTLVQKNIMVSHPLLNQIRMGMHDDQGQQNLHVVMDLTNVNVSVVDTQQEAQKLTLTLQYINQP